MAMARSDFGERLKSIFHQDSNQRIAEKIGVSAPAVQNYKDGRVPPYETLLRIQAVTNCDLHWLLTGELKTRPRSEQDRGIEEIIREIVREELAAARPIQELGTVDEFDLDAAMQRNDSVMGVLTEWLHHEGREMPPDFHGASPYGGWDKMTNEERKHAVRDLKKLLDND